MEKRGAYFIALLLCVLFVIGAVYSFDLPNGRNESHSGSKDKVLRFDVNSPLGSFNPFSVGGTGLNNIFPLFYSYLFIPNAKGQLQGDLAIRWTYDPNKNCWNISLRTDSQFHNGRPVTAKDVQYSLNKWVWEINPALEAVIDRIEPVGDHHLCIYLKKAAPNILQILWSKEIIPSPAGSALDYINHPVGSGPFQFSQRQGNRMVILKANPDYFGGRPVLDHIECAYQPDREKAWTRLLTAATDIAMEISPKNFEIIEKYQDRFYFDHLTLPHYTILLYNTHDPLFSAPQVRQALTMGIDRQAIVRDIFKGFGKVATGPMGVNSPYNSPEIKPWPYNPNKALELLKQNGWALNKKGRLLRDDQPFEFTLFVYQESLTDKKVARFIQLSLNKLGIRVHLKALKFEELVKRYEKNTAFQAVLTEMVGAHRRPEALMNIWATDSRGNSFAGNFAYPQVTRQLVKAFAQKSPAKQRMLLQQFDRLIVELQPGTFLFHKTAIDVMSRRFHLPDPFELTMEGIYRLKDASPRHN